MKKIILAGGTGFLGQALQSHFTNQGHQVLILTRNPNATHHILWDGYSLGEWTQHLEGSDVVINLCGKSVDCRYTEANKKAILDSRLGPTRILDNAIHLCSSKPRHFINASSATIYIQSEQQPMTERDGTIGDDFSMNVVKQWEAAFFENQIDGVKKVALRTSIVLGPEGGAYPKLKLMTKLGLGGHQGSGQQMVSWIHIEDFCRAVEHILYTPHLEGPINVTAPHPLTNRNFMEEIRQIVNPLFYIPQPKFLLELGALMLGTETELLLKSRYVIPERLLDSGFRFRYEEVGDMNYLPQVPTGLLT